MILLALLPAALLFIFVYRKDKIEAEPIGFLIRLFLLGGLTIISAMVLGGLGEAVLESILAQGTIVYMLIDNFILTALVEEGGKYFVLKKKIWHSKEFNYTFDAVVYAVTVSLGFAAFENVLYCLDSDIGTAVMRAVFAVPGHAIDGVFMGYYYGLAKYSEFSGNMQEVRSDLRKALFIPVLLHGFYDFCLESQYDIFILIFLIFELVITIYTIRKLNGLSKTDMLVAASREDNEEK